ncbi:hypothetical protein PDJAM_G00114500 [Pangasius djambal]|uniref:Uncharacterized protein n=1 Tax=Pangasius djambal TaxID=1691987 RepID=A0ACC5Y3C8_9TELE|nr:hypothetical protein [Pangasius djambal]
MLLFFRIIHFLYISANGSSSTSCFSVSHEPLQFSARNPSIEVPSLKRDSINTPTGTSQCCPIRVAWEPSMRICSGATQPPPTAAVPIGIK